LSNRETKPITWESRRGVRLEMFAPDGSPVPFTNLGKTKFGFREFESSFFKPLEPGKSETFVFRLRDYFELQPGRYVVCASVPINARDGLAVSPLLKIEIPPPKP
jgi:hypothetical protein